MSKGDSAGRWQAFVSICPFIVLWQCHIVYCRHQVHDVAGVLAVCFRDPSILLLVPLHAKCCFEHIYTRCVQDNILTCC